MHIAPMLHVVTAFIRTYALHTHNIRYNHISRHYEPTCISSYRIIYPFVKHQTTSSSSSSSRYDDVYRIE